MPKDLAALPLAPLDETITIEALTRDPYPIYRRLRAEAPVCRVASVKRTLLTKAAHTRMVKDDPVLFSSNDPNTPMKRAFGAHTLMRKDGVDHRRERMAMAPAFNPKVIKEHWSPIYRQAVEDYVARLPRGETVDLFHAFAAPVAARCLSHLLGIPEASDDDMIFWSQALIDGAGNFGWAPEPFKRSDRANAQMEALFDRVEPLRRSSDGLDAFSVMVNAAEPIADSQIRANIKIAIGGGLNEPRDAMLTAVYGLLANREQFEAAKAGALWDDTFEESIRWVAPIQASSRLVTADTEIGGCFIPEGDTVMTIQASANRDEEVYKNGEIFDILRGRPAHQAFGNGPHFCQGKHVARMLVAQHVLPVLFDRFPKMTLPEPEKAVFSGFGFRGPISMPVTLN